MIITYQGHACFKIQDKTGSDGITLMTDVFDKSVGFRIPNCEANIVTVSHDHHDHNNTGALRANPFIIDSAGEYDVSGVLVEGITSYHDNKQGQERGLNTIYRIEMDDIVVVHLGDLGHVLESEQIEKLTNTDILLVPVGGKYTIDAKQAIEVINQIEPRIVIPMHYRTSKAGLKEIDTLENFKKEFGLPAEVQDKLKINKKDLPSEDMELVILEPLG